VTAAEELSRVRPALRAIASAIPIPISIDTYKAAVADAALDEGAGSSTTSAHLNTTPSSDRWWPPAGCRRS
jgi:hypothetical protein